MERTHQLPVGTITFMFTDIEGSTRMVQGLGDEFRSLIETHDATLRRAFEPHGGVEVRTVGDAFFVAFTSAPAAVRAAVDIQRGIAAQTWPRNAAVRVRIGLHTGHGELGGDDYVGVDVHLAARISGVAHGGQTLLSDATAALARSGAADAVVRDLGEHGLKDFDRPQRLYQVDAPGLTTDFPPPRTRDAHPNNLPAQLTTLVGRETASQEICALLAQHRLVALTGPGGTGKTRLSLHIGQELLPTNADGVFFVGLETVDELAGVVPSIAEALGVRDVGDRPLLERLRDHLATRELLLILDNCEQIEGIGRLIGELLAAAPSIRVLATSQAGLHVRGGRSFAVPPLSLPSATGDPDVEESGSVALFMDRARDHSPEFVADTETARTIAKIVRRLDGLPLAIELAAARLRVFEPEELLHRLDRSLDTLRARGGDRPERHLTLRSAIAWTHELLGAEERGAFELLGVFAGGFSLESAEALAPPDLQPMVIDAIEDLLDKSLIARDLGPQGQTRFRMLSTIRAFARERLIDRGRLDEVAQRHAQHFAQVCEQAGEHLQGARQIWWMDRLTQDHDNVRTALRFAIASGQGSLAADIASPIWRFWSGRGHLLEASDWFEEILGCELGVVARARTLEAAAGIIYWRGDYQQARTSYEDAYALFESEGLRKGMADALFGLSASAAFLGDGAASEDAFGKANDLYEALGDKASLARLWSVSALRDMVAGDMVPALEKLERGFALGAGADEHWAFQSALGLALGLMDTDLPRARELSTRSADFFHRAQDVASTAMGIEWLARVVHLEGDSERAVMLMASANKFREASGGGWTPTELGQRPTEELIRATIGEEQWDALWAAGCDLSMRAAIDLACGR